jgi:hypothetical protein
MRVSRSHSVVTIAAVFLSIGCDDPIRPPDHGAIQVVVLASGEDVISDGMRVNILNGPIRQFGSGSLDLLVQEMAPGVHAVRIEGMAANCQIVSANPRSVTVVSNQTTIAEFSMTCSARVGSVRVAAATTGADIDPDGYTATVIGGPSGPISVNGTATLASVREGSRLVTLGGVAPNCTITGPDTLGVLVALGATADVAFSLQCQTGARLHVTVATTGVDLDPDGYTAAVDASSIAFTGRLGVSPNGTVTFSQLGPASDYVVTLQGVAVNCEFVGVDVHTVAIAAGGTASVAFDVACTAPTQLAVVRDDDIYVIASNGTGATRLTTELAFDGSPAWSSTGRIAFMTRRHSNDAELNVMNADGTNQVRITTSAGDDDAPSWSPDGQRIVFRSFRDVNSEIYVVNADGSGLTRLTNNTADDVQPAWSSTGKIAFISYRDNTSGEIYVMNADGSNVVRLTNNSVGEVSPAWSPDGSMIAFARAIDCYYYCWQDIFVINADGSNERRLETGNGEYLYNADPAWSPNGQTIAFTQQYCPYYCDPPQVWTVDLHGTVPVLLVSNASDPAWRP